MSKNKIEEEIIFNIELITLVSAALTSASKFEIGGAGCFRKHAQSGNSS